MFVRACTDHSTWMCSLFESLRFRAHLHNLLYDYVKKHCTVDYLTFTEDLVSEFFGDFQPVTLNDPHLLTLPVDPLDILENIYSKIPPYSPWKDVLQVSQEAASLLKEFAQIGAGKSKITQIVMNDSYGDPPLREQLYPVLTRRTRQLTRKLGNGESKRPGTFNELFGESKLGVLEVERLEEPSVDAEDTLKVKITVDTAEQSAVGSLLQSTLNVLRQEKQLDSAFLCGQFPPEPTYIVPEDVFIPLFPRNRQIASSTPVRSGEPTDFRSLIESVSAPFEPVDIVKTDDDISHRNLVLVDGWETIKSSPPSTPLSRCSGDGEIDELDIQFPSSPCTTPPLIEELEKCKMEQTLIPRSRCIGGKSGIMPHILHGRTLETFIRPLLSRPLPEREEGPGPERVPSPAPSSLIGQPPSALDMNYDIESEVNNLDFDIGLEVQKICKGYAFEPDFFLNEVADDRTALLMEVPILLQPNEFPKDFHVPNSFSDFVIPHLQIRGQRPNVDDPVYRFLKKVKGCQSLGLALSWVPFTIDTHPPTVAEVLDVAHDLFLLQGAEYTQGLTLIDSVDKSEYLTDVSVRYGQKVGLEDLVYEPPAEEFRIMSARNSVQKSSMDVSRSSSHAALETCPFEPASALSDSLNSRSQSSDNVFSSPRGQSDALADLDPELARNSLGSFAFAQLRGRKVSMARLEPAPVEILANDLPNKLPHGPPPEVCDNSTIYLTDAIPPQSIHKYMASLRVIQKQALVRALCSKDCAVELVERQDLGGVDLILDTDAAVIYLNLLTLPIRCEDSVHKVANTTWKYDKLLVVLEAYTERSAKTNHGRSSLSTSASPQPSPYTPPIVKALKKFKRDLGIAEGCGTKRNTTVIQYAFASTVQEAALFSRLYGDWCEASDRTGGAIWGNREWLDADVLEDEEAILASLNGMNHFSASIILCQVSVEEFMDLLPEERIAAFGPYIPADCIRDCNEDLAVRLLSMQTGQT